MIPPLSHSGVVKAGSVTVSCQSHPFKSACPSRCPHASLARGPNQCHIQNDTNTTLFPALHIPCATILNRSPASHPIPWDDIPIRHGHPCGRQTRPQHNGCRAGALGGNARFPPLGQLQICFYTAHRGNCGDNRASKTLLLSKKLLR